MSERRYNSNDVDTAMCIWEYILEQTRSKDAMFGTPPDKWERALETDGTASLRDWVIGQIDVVWDAYELAGGGEVYNRCFDWDFVPAFMDRAYDDELELRLEWEEIAKEIFREAAL